MKKDNTSLTIILSLNISALVTRSQKGFLVQSFKDGKNEFLSDSFLENCKTAEDFIAAFAKPFASKSILLSVEANQQMTAMLTKSKAEEANSSTAAIPYSVIELKSTLLVNHFKEGFEVELLSTGKDKFVPASQLTGSNFKYTSDFVRKFVDNLCSGPRVCILSVEANNYMINLISFNRIDS